MKEGYLSSWKEIAQYLGWDIKTCQRWEKGRGLPIHRLEGTKKSRVVAYQDELDLWLKENFGNNNSHPQSGMRKKHKIKLKYLYVFLPLSFILLYLIIPTNSSRRQPSDFRIDRSNLVILDSAGKEIWRYDTKLENLDGFEFYKNHFQHKKLIPTEYGSDMALPHLMIKDLNKDGMNEVLFSPATENDVGAGQVICFDYKGKFLCEHKTGRKIQFGKRTFHSDFALSGFDTRDINEDGKEEIIILAHANSEFPTQLLVLDHKNEVLGEYWNVGQFGDLEYADIDGDGYEEILLAGQNNEYEKPCLVVLSLNSIHGGSPQTPAFSNETLGRGGEIFYILLPLTDVDQFFKPGIGIFWIELLRDPIIRVSTTVSCIFYEFSFSLDLQSVNLSHVYERRRNSLFSDGKIKDSLNKEKTIKDLARGILYFDGRTKTWTNKRAMSNPRGDPHY